MANVKRINDTLNSIYHIFTYLDDATCPKDLFTALESELSHIAKDSWDERLNWGGIYINGIHAKGNETLTTPCKVEYYEPKISITEQKKNLPNFSTEQIIYEDSQFLAAYKPAGISCQIAKEQKQFSLYRQLSTYCKQSIHMPSRLDFSTAGIVLVSKDVDAHAALQQIFENNKIKKTYLLEIACPVNWEEKTIDLKIARDPKHPVLRKSSTTQGKPAKTIFKKLQSKETSLLEAKPLTGRTHQIRVHSLELGSPIIGDNFYEGQEDDSLHLLSYSVEFVHPVSGKNIIIKLPDKFIPNWAKLDD